MKTNLPRSLAFDLAHLCAERIHANLITLHLEGLDKAEGKQPVPLSVEAANWNSYWRGEKLAQVRQVVTSIEDRWDRADFVGHLRYLFTKMRDEKGTIPTTRAYVAKVQALEKSAAPTP
jgi:hypothetical protein